MPRPSRPLSLVSPDRTTGRSVASLLVLASVRSHLRVFPFPSSAHAFFFFPAFSSFDGPGCCSHPASSLASCDPGAPRPSSARALLLSSASFSFDGPGCSHPASLLASFDSGDRRPSSTGALLLASASSSLGLCCSSHPASSLASFDFGARRPSFARTLLPFPAFSSFDFLGCYSHPASSLASCDSGSRRPSSARGLRPTRRLFGVSMIPAAVFIPPPSSLLLVLVLGARLTRALQLFPASSSFGDSGCCLRANSLLFVNPVVALRLLPCFF